MILDILPVIAGSTVVGLSSIFLCALLVIVPTGEMPDHLKRR